MKNLLFGLALIGILVACENLRYSQVDCATLEGKSARLCQEYRQRKADADIREGVAQLIKNYRFCLQEMEAEKTAGKSARDCSMYEPALRALAQVAPLNLNQ